MADELNSSRSTRNGKREVVEFEMDLGLEEESLRSLADLALKEIGRPNSKRERVRYFTGFKTLALFVSTTAGAIGLSLEVFDVLLAKYGYSPLLGSLLDHKALWGAFLGVLASALVLRQEGRSR
jgi:hypothetical protein